jgi:hypothetical protein
MVSVSMGGGHALGGPTEHPQPNTALHLTAYSLRFAMLSSGFQRQVSFGVRPLKVSRRSRHGGAGHAADPDEDFEYGR